MALPRQPAFAVDQGGPAGCGVAPAPEDQIEVVIARAMGEAAHQQSVVAGGQKPCGEGLRRGFAGGLHLVAPGGIGKGLRGHAFGPQGGIVPAVEEMPDVRLIGVTTRKW